MMNRMVNMMNKAIYAGSFDPITNGHVWMVEQGAKLFDELIVTVGNNPEKKHTFSLEERLALLEASVGRLSGVSIDSFENKFLVEHAKAIGVQYILRGIRSGNDYEYERSMRHINSDLQGGILTVFLMPPREIAEVSSSMVKSMVGPQGWEAVIGRYVPAPVYIALVEKLGLRD